MIRFAAARRARGVSMIEVLVAVVIFSIGLLGIALMQIRGATFTKESGARTAAVLQARSLVDRMQANPAGIAAGDYVWPAGSSGAPPTMQVPCSGGSLADCTAQNDLAEWLAQIKASAPASATGTNYGTVTKNSDGSYTIKVSWNGLLDTTGSGTDSDASESVIFIPPQLGNS